MKQVIISYVCLILIILTDSASVTRWELSKQNNYGKVLVNSTIELDCLKDPSINDTELISWYRHGIPISYEFKGRFYKAPRSVLGIINVTKEDQGEYKCRRFIGRYEHTVATGNLDVLVPPKFIHLNITKSTIENNYVENGQISLECCTNANSNPSPDFKWFHYGKEIIQNVMVEGPAGQKCSRTLVELNREANEFPFTCHVSNEAIKKPLTSELKINVEYKPVQVQMFLNNKIKLNDSKVWLFKEENAELSCQAKALPSDVTYEWYFNGRMISKEQILELKNFKNNHIGDYACSVANKHGKAFSFVKSIDIPYLKLSTLNSILINTTKNEAIELACKVESNRAPSRIIWSFDKEPILNTYQNETNISKLKIKTTTSKDAGIYRCSINEKLTNTKGLSINIKQNRMFNINFQYKPEISLFKSNYYVNLNETVKFICEVNSNPKVSGISWLFNNKLIKFDKTPAKSIENQNSLTSIHSVSVKSETDFGQYSCQAFNSIGKSFKIINLNRTKKPLKPANLTAEKITSNSAFISWKSTSFAEPTRFILTINNSTEITIPGEQFDLEMNELNSNETYEIKILEENEEGLSELSESITFKTLELLPMSLPTLDAIELDIEDGICFEQDKFNSSTQFIKVQTTGKNQTEFKIQPISSEGGKYCVNHSQLTNLTIHDLKLSICYTEHSKTCSNPIKVQLQQSKASKSIVFNIILIILGTVFSVTIITLFSIQRKRNNRVIEDAMYWDPKVDNIDFIDSSNSSDKNQPPVTLTSARYDRNPVYNTTSHYINTKF